MLRLWLQAGAVLWLAPPAPEAVPRAPEAALRGPGAAAGRLYTEEDPVRILSGGRLKQTVTGSSSAWLVQFYSSWCGHCIQYSGTWKALAQDVKDWGGAVGVAVLDCAQEENFDVCREFNIKFYPTIKVFRAHSPPADHGTAYRGADRGIQAVRQLMVDLLQNHTSTDRPEHCPQLQPYSAAQLLPLLGRPADHYTAILLEEPDSYVGREVILDLLLYSGVQVRRALTSDLPLLDALKVTHFPSIYLLHPNGSHAPLPSEKRLRFFFSSLLRSLPGVQRRSVSTATATAPTDRRDSELWGDADRSQVYLADLESTLHYLLRVELAARRSLEGAELRVFRDFVTLVAKLYPGGGSVGRLLETLSDWLLALPLQRIPYQAVLDLVDNKMQISGVFLGAELRWVGCRGSRPGLRGYPCGLWTLFHVLTVQHEATPTALKGTGLEAEAAPVLQVMRRYVRTFFGCQDCGRHFEQAAAASMDAVQGGEQQILWLWEQHNRVNARLAGSLSDDPSSPKAPWPGPALCPSCHGEQDGVHVWDRGAVLRFLRRHYSAAHLSPWQPGPNPTRAPGRGVGPGPTVARGRGPGLGVEAGPGPGPSRAPGLTPAPGPAPAHRWVLGLGFTSLDVSLCLGLYVCSGLVLMLLCFFFRVRSRRGRTRLARLLV
ncbi:sulfhydryl oxidase 2 [Menidia menidia]